MALLAVPRIVRLLYPQVWIEDESYLNGAFMLSRGWMPYRDFPLPHLPALEALLAAVFLVAPASIRTAELVTQTSALAGSGLVFLLGREMERRGDAPRHTPAAAAAVFAMSALLFRYHVFEREIFVVPAVVAAVWMCVRAAGAARAAAPGRRAPDEPAPAEKASPYVWAGLLLAVAMAVKLTAFAALAAVLVHLWLAGRRRAAALVAGVSLGLVGVSGLVLTAAFGVDFLVQVALFRAVHAAFPSLAVKLDEMRYTLDVSLAAGGMGVVLLLWTGAWRRWTTVLLQLASGVVFLVVLNPTYWAHTGIELLPWLALTSGYLIASVVRRVAPGRPREDSGGRTRSGSHAKSSRSAPRGVPAGRQPALVCGAAALALLFTVVPLRNLNWQAGDGSRYGFGYRSRSEILAAAAYVRSHADADASVATPPIIAFEANRREVIPYAEVAGEIDELTTGVRQAGWLATLEGSASGRQSFWESVEASRDRMAPTLERAIASHAAAVVINDSPDDLFPFPMIDVAQETLEADGYRLGAVWAHYEAWIGPQR